MKQFVTSLRSLLLSSFAALFVVAMTLTGCSADSLSGPDVEAVAEGTAVNADNGTQQGGQHNEGPGGGAKNGTQQGGQHNEGPGDRN